MSCHRDLRRQSTHVWRYDKACGKRVIHRWKMLGCKACLAISTSYYWRLSILKNKSSKKCTVAGSLSTPVQHRSDLTHEHSAFAHGNPVILQGSKVIPTCQRDDGVCVGATPLLVANLACCVYFGHVSCRCKLCQSSMHDDRCVDAKLKQDRCFYPECSCTAYRW